jgi:hypothetical protein
MSDRRERAGLVMERLNDPSRLLLSGLDGHPAHGVASTFMELGGDGAWNLAIKIPPPTGDRRRNLSAWIDENGVPSMEFGRRRTHADLWDTDPLGVEKMLCYLERIPDGNVQLTAVPVDPEAIPFCVLDLEHAQECIEERGRRRAEAAAPRRFSSRPRPAYMTWQVPVVVPRFARADARS